jgi:hypothetical protein
MAARKPVVLNNGVFQQLQAGDTLSGVSGISANQADGSIRAEIDGGGAVPAAGTIARVVADCSGTITAATVLMLDLSGSVVLDVRKCTYAQYDGGGTHPVTADKISASAPPTVTTAWKSVDTTLTGWTLAVTAGDVFEFAVSSISTVTHFVVILSITKS